MNLNHLGSLIKKARRDRGMTQAELARKAGVCRNTISAIENDSFDELGIRRVDRVCSVLRLGVSIGPFERTPDDVDASAVEAAERADGRIERARGILG
jgi:transcriptional regulator with XRE-family HTH domain